MSSEKGGSSKKSSMNASKGASDDHQVVPGTSAASDGQTTKTRMETVLPQAKVKVIMKSSPEIDNISTDSVYLITKATELFIDHLTREAFASSKGSKNLEYKDLSDVVHKHENLEFLRDIIPIKIPAWMALAEMAKQKEMDDKVLFE